MQAHWQTNNKKNSRAFAPEVDSPNGMLCSIRLRRQAAAEHLEVARTSDRLQRSRTMQVGNELAARPTEEQLQLGTVQGQEGQTKKKEEERKKENEGGEKKRKRDHKQKENKRTRRVLSPHNQLRLSPRKSAEDYHSGQHNTRTMDVEQ
jgi:electron transfer flavoprotein alpha subunit